MQREKVRLKNHKSFETNGNERRFFFTCVIVASALTIIIILIQSYRHKIFGTNLMLGWDTPAYVWVAKYVIAKGPINMAYAWNYPSLYVQLLAFFGYLTGNVVIIERTLPILFCILLIYANSELTYRITKHVYIAGLAAFLTVLSANVLLILSSLHRNLMALSLSFIVLLLVPNLLDEEKRILKKKLASLILILLVIAATQFETYFVLVLSLLLYGFLTKNLKNLIMLTSSCTIPIAILVLLFPAYFFQYISTIVVFERELTIGEVLMWTGGSWVLLGFLIIGSYFFYKSKLRNYKLVSLIFSWCLTILLIVASIGIKLAPFSNEFAYRSLLLMPVPILLALATSGCNDFLNHWQSKQSSLSAKKKRSIGRLLISLIALCLIVSSAPVAVRYASEFLTPYIPRSGYEKIIMVKDYLADNPSPTPVFVFRGDPPVWYVGLYRNYLGAEIGEHFAYYGEVENLFRLLPSESKIKYDFYLSQVEKYYITFYFNEMLGNFSGPPPPMFIHDSYITNVTELMSHPIVIITPEFYNQEIPYCINPFYIGDGIYVIPPNSQIDFTKISYGPEITVMRDNIPFKINCTYLHIDPEDPSIVYVSVNASHGYASYNFTNFPSNWVFQRIEQGGDISFPEVDPRRVNGTKASSGNDPADSMVDWSSPWPEQDATLEIDTSTKKEGYASLQITGKTDSLGCLSVRYDTPGAWNLAGYSSISVWVRCNESALFSITLVDCYGGSRTFWAIEAGDGSATTGWKRFVVNLTDYTSQTPGFSINSVDHISLFVYSAVGKSLSFWIDDLTVDTSVALEKTIYKDRVPVDETVVAYFYTRIEDK